MMMLGVLSAFIVWQLCCMAEVMWWVGERDLTGMMLYVFSVTMLPF